MSLQWFLILRKMLVYPTIDVRRVIWTSKIRYSGCNLHYLAGAKFLLQVNMSAHRSVHKLEFWQQLHGIDRAQVMQKDGIFRRLIRSDGFFAIRICAHAVTETRKIRCATKTRIFGYKKYRRACWWHKLASFQLFSSEKMNAHSCIYHKKLEEKLAEMIWQHLTDSR